jgi:hypothetical protein
VDTDENREIRMALNVARLQLEAIELAAQLALQAPTLDALRSIDDARAILEDSVGRVRRIALRALERETLER